MKFSSNFVVLATEISQNRPISESLSTGAIAQTRRFRKMKIAAAAAFFAVLAPTIASAATVSQDFAFSNTSGIRAFLSQTLSSFEKYDGPDNLTNVELSVNVTANGNVSADLCNWFQDCDPANATLTGSGTLAFAAFSVADSDGSGITNFTNANQFGTFSLGISVTQGFANLADFIGSGNVNGVLTILGNYQGYAIINTTYSGTVSLAYTTEAFPTAVPLPATLPLLIAGVGGLALTRRRRS
jgi:hypothetical protein